MPKKVVPPRLQSILTQRLLTFNPSKAFLTTLVFGILVITVGALAYSGTVDDYIVDGHTYFKQTGFLYAINWTGALLIFPFSLLLISWALTSVDSIIIGLTSRKMILAGERIAAAPEVRQLWIKSLENTVPAMVALAVIGTIASLIEWWTNSGLILLRNEPWGQGTIEVDWSIAAIVDSSGHFAASPAAPRIANALFSLIVFLWQAVIAANFGVILCASVAFTEFMRNATSGPVFTGIPDVDSSDDHRGFEEVEPFVANVLGATLLMWIIFFLSRLWNAYLRTPVDNMSSFVSAALQWGVGGMQTSGMTKFLPADGGVGRTL